MEGKYLICIILNTRYCIGVFFLWIIKIDKMEILSEMVAEVLVRVLRYLHVNNMETDDESNAYVKKYCSKIAIDLFTFILEI